MLTPDSNARVATGRSLRSAVTTRETQRKAYATSPTNYYAKLRTFCPKKAITALYKHADDSKTYAIHVSIGSTRNMHCTVKPSMATQM